MEKQEHKPGQDKINKIKISPDLLAKLSKTIRTVEPQITKKDKTN